MKLKMFISLFISFLCIETISITFLFPFWCCVLCLVCGLVLGFFGCLFPLSHISVLGNLVCQFSEFIRMFLLNVHSFYLLLSYMISFLWLPINSSTSLVNCLGCNLDNFISSTRGSTHLYCIFLFLKPPYLIYSATSMKKYH